MIQEVVGLISVFKMCLLINNRMKHKRRRVTLFPVKGALDATKGNVKVGG